MEEKIKAQGVGDNKLLGCPGGSLRIYGLD